MTTPYGQLAGLAIAFQNSFGTAASTSSLNFIPFLSESVSINKPPLTSENMRGVFDEGDDYEGPNTVDGTVEAEAQPLPLGALLKTVLGNPTSVQSGGIYSHTFKPRTTDWDDYAANQPVTVYKDLGDSGSSQLFYDLNGSMLELSIGAGEFLKAKVDFVGGNFSQIAAVAKSYPVGKRWKWDVGSFTVGGTAKPELMNMTVKVDEKLEAQHTLNGSKFPSRIRRTGFRTVEVNGTLKFDNQTEYQQFLSQSERELIVNFVGVTEIQSGYYETILMKLPLLRYREAKPAVGGPGPVEMSITGAGKYSVTSATAFQITLVNTKAAY